jgi:tRNA pseudouridine32 synthase/23S rRNA pseudouridine746 synthase
MAREAEFFLFMPPSSFVILPAESAGFALLDFLAQRFAHVPRSEWQARFADGLVLGADGLPASPSTPCQPQQRVYYSRRLAAEPRIPVQEQVLYEDETLVVADKPHFLPVTPSGRYVRETLLYRLRERLHCPTLSPAHRIDRDTAGLVLLTKQPAHRAAYQNLFRDRLVEKTYHAIAPAIDVMQAGMVHWLPAWQGLDAQQRWAQLCATGVSVQAQIQRSARAFLQMDCQPGLQSPQANAQTHIKIVAAQAGFTALNAENSMKNWLCYELRPATGQRHQLRAQMNALGVPILGDGIYPVLTPEHLEPHTQMPLQLLARELRFIDPITGQGRHFVSNFQLQQA